MKEKSKKKEKEEKTTLQKVSAYIYFWFLEVSLRKHIMKRWTKDPSLVILGFMTIYEIAALTGYSIATVSRVLNGVGSVKESTRQRIQKAVTSTGYTPNLIARDLTTRGGSRTVGLVLPGVNSYFSPAVEAVTRRILGESGHVLITSNPSGGWNVKDEVDSLKLLLSKRVQGVIFFASRILPEHLEVFSTWPSSIPLVTVNDHIPQSSISSVIPDPEPGYRALLAHLVLKGKRRIALIEGPQENKTAEERSALLRKLLPEYSLESREEWCHQGYFDMNSGAQITKKLLETREFDTLVCANDFMAVGALQTLHSQGVRVPQDVAVTGYDNLDIAGFTYPALTTLAQSPLDLGLAALDLILAQWVDNNQNHLTLRLPSSLVVRSTT